jgi:hypothetical protein
VRSPTFCVGGGGEQCRQWDNSIPPVRFPSPATVSDPQTRPQFDCSPPMIAERIVMSRGWAPVWAEVGCLEILAGRNPELCFLKSLVNFRR